MSSTHNQGLEIGFYDKGVGEAVVLLHASAASRRQGPTARPSGVVVEAAAVFVRRLFSL